MVALTGRTLRKFPAVDGFRFSEDLSVRFSETDAQGIANNAVYLNWFEVARVAYLARFRGGYKGLIESGVEAVTLETHVRYRAPCRFDDRLRIWVRVPDPERLRARFRFEYAIERDGEVGGRRLDEPRHGGRRVALARADARLARRRDPRRGNASSVGEA